MILQSFILHIYFLAEANNDVDKKVSLSSNPLNNHRYEPSPMPHPSLNEVVNNDKKFQTEQLQHQGQYSELQETLYDFHDRMDHEQTKKDQDYQYYDYGYSSSTNAQKPEDEYSNQQVDRLDVDYEYYEEDEDEDEAAEYNEADKDYDYVYYYYLDYIDNDSNVEKLPKPSYQKEEKVQ